MRYVGILLLIGLFCQNNPMDQETLGRRLFVASGRPNGVERVRSLLEEGAPLEFRDDFHLTPLHFAVLRNRYDVAKLLIEHGADVNAADKRLITPLHTAAKKGNDQLMHLLLDAGARVDEQDDFGETPLHRGARLGSPSIVDMLIIAGADERIKEQQGKRPVDIAHESVAHLLRVPPLERLAARAVQQDMQEGDFQDLPLATRQSLARVTYKIKKDDVAGESDVE